MVDERDKGDKLWELLSKLHENPPKADHGKTVRAEANPTTYPNFFGAGSWFCIFVETPFRSEHFPTQMLNRVYLAYV